MVLMMTSPPPVWIDRRPVPVGQAQRFSTVFLGNQILSLVFGFSIQTFQAEVHLHSFLTLIGAQRMSEENKTINFGSFQKLLILTKVRKRVCDSN